MPQRYSSEEQGSTASPAVLAAEAPIRGLPEGVYSTTEGPLHKDCEPESSH